jgi:hypothetical protein
MVIASNGAARSDALIKNGTFPSIIPAIGNGGLGEAQLWDVDASILVRRNHDVAP